MTLRYLPPTQRRGMTKARVTRIFVANGGKCAICGMPIREAEKYDIEHPDPLWAGGSDDDAKLTVVHVKCHAAKTKAEAGQRARRNETIARGYADKPPSKLSKEYRRQVQHWIESRNRETDETEIE